MRDTLEYGCSNQNLWLRHFDQRVVYEKGDRNCPQKGYAKWLFPMWMRLFDAPKIFRGGIFDILDVVKHQYEHMITRPRINAYASFSKELQQAIHKALTKVKTPQKALNDAAKRLTT